MHIISLLLIVNTLKIHRVIAESNEKINLKFEKSSDIGRLDHKKQLDMKLSVTSSGVWRGHSQHPLVGQLKKIDVYSLSHDQVHSTLKSISSTQSVPTINKLLLDQLIMVKYKNNNSIKLQNPNLYVKNGCKERRCFIRRRLEVSDSKKSNFDAKKQRNSPRMSRINYNHLRKRFAEDNNTRLSFMENSKDRYQMVTHGPAFPHHLPFGPSRFLGVTPNEKKPLDEQDNANESEKSSRREEEIQFHEEQIETKPRELMLNYLSKSSMMDKIISDMYIFVQKLYANFS